MRRPGEMEVVVDTKLPASGTSQVTIPTMLPSGRIGAIPIPRHPHVQIGRSGHRFYFRAMPNGDWRYVTDVGTLEEQTARVAEAVDEWERRTSAALTEFERAMWALYETARESSVHGDISTVVAALEKVDVARDECERLGITLEPDPVPDAEEWPSNGCQLR